MNRDYDQEMQTAQKPNILFRAIMIFVIVALVIIGIILTYSTDPLHDEEDRLNDELREERLKEEELKKRLGNGDEMTDEEKAAEAERLGYKEMGGQRFERDLSNS